MLAKPENFIKNTQDPTTQLQQLVSLTQKILTVVVSNSTVPKQFSPDILARVAHPQKVSKLPTTSTVEIGENHGSV